MSNVLPQPLQDLIGKHFSMQQSYLGYVRFAMDCALSLQTIASKSTANSLANLLRLVCGGIRSTPTAACKIDANVEPLELHRDRSLLESVDRYRRLDKNHPNRKLVDSWKPKILDWILDVAKSLQSHHPLPLERLPLEALENFLGSSHQDIKQKL